MCADRPRRAHAVRPAQRGLSMVELLVAIVVSLLVSLAASRSAVLFTAMQRQNIGSGGAAVGSATTLAAMKEDVGQAGLGFFGNSSYLCPSLNLSVNTGNLSQAPFSPLRVTRSNGQDQLDVVYATMVTGGANVSLHSASPLTSAELQSYLPVVAGDAVLLAPKDTTAGTVCTVRSVTGVTAATATTFQQLAFGAGGLHNQVAFGAPTFYPVASKVTMLGTLMWRRYRVDNGTLVLEQPLAAGGTTSAVLLRNVVALRVRIGVTPGTAATDTALSQWVAPTVPATGASTWGQLGPSDIGRARAVRVTLVTRSAQPEKPVNGSCLATPTAIRLFDDAADTFTPPNVGSTDWRCYRYRAADVVIPLRNWITGLRPDPT